MIIINHGSNVDAHGVQILDSLRVLQHKVDSLMTTAAELRADLADVKGQLADIKTGVGNVVGMLTTQGQTITALQAQIANLLTNQPVTQEQLDALDAQAEDAKTQGAEIIAALAPFAPPAPSVPVPSTSAPSSPAPSVPVPSTPIP